MTFRWVLAALVVVTAAAWNSCVSAGNGGGSSTTTALMWVATQGDQMVRSYSVNLTTGATSQRGSAVATGAQPSAMALTPDGSTLFIANTGDNTISAYSVKSDGTLTAQGSPTPAGEFPSALAMDPSGKLLFAANLGTFSDNTSGTISVFSIQGGSLTPVPGSPFPTETLGDTTDTGPIGLAVSPSGSFLYVANQFTSTVQSFSYDSSGTLSLIATYAAGTNPSALAFSRCAGGKSANPSCANPDAASLFVANAGSNNISTFSACIITSTTCPTPNGLLTPLSSGGTVPAGIGPAAFMVDPAADFVYVLDRGSAQISEYKYSPVTGALSVGNPSTASTGSSPFSGGISSNTASNSSAPNWILVTNNGASSLSEFSVATGGRLSPVSTGPIAVPGQPSAILVR